MYICDNMCVFMACRSATKAKTAKKLGKDLTGHIDLRYGRLHSKYIVQHCSARVEV